MKVILLKDDKNLGKKGELVEAKDGHARNFLIPRKIAIEANEENLANWKEEKRLEAEEDKKNREKFTELKNKMEKTEILLKAKAGEGGRLFGAITSKDIAEEISKKMGIEIDKRKVELADNIKMEGTKTVVVKLYQDISANVRVKVEAK